MDWLTAEGGVEVEGIGGSGELLLVTGLGCSCRVRSRARLKSERVLAVTPNSSSWDSSTCRSVPKKVVMTESLQLKLISHHDISGSAFSFTTYLHASSDLQRPFRWKLTSRVCVGREGVSTTDGLTSKLHLLRC